MLQRAIMALAILVILPAAASAGAITYYGAHMGFGQSPDQTVIGGQLQMNGVAPRMAFVPGIDYAFNDLNSVVTLNGDFHYNLTYETAWQPYVGLGAAVNLRSQPSPRNRNERVDRTDPQARGELIVGAAIRNHGGGRFFTEMKLGFGESPGLKMLAGWNVRNR